jgi:ABC-type Na+ efflux pump permease subunit
MRKVWAVIRREYRDRIRKKSFWIGTLIFPLLMGLLIFGQFGLMMLKTGEQRRLAVIDATGQIGRPFLARAARRPAGVPGRVGRLAWRCRTSA